MTQTSATKGGSAAPTHAGHYRPTAIDLFCGVGGMSLGFRSAGFNVVGAVDIDPVHVAAYNRNLGEGSAVEGDLVTMTGEELRQLFLPDGAQVDVVFGGPPCQGFSVGGRREANDPRNEMLGEYARIVLEIRPRAFVAENVAGLMAPAMIGHLEEFLAELRDGGYEIVEPVSVLNAADYGVPQRRRRVFVLGHLRDVSAAAYPKASRRHVTVRQAIDDLLQVGADDDLFESNEYRGRLGRPSRYVSRLRSTFEDVRLQSGNGSPAGLTGLRRSRHSPATVERFAGTTPGTADPVSRFFRLDESGQAPTLRAGTDSTRGSYTAPRPIHYAEPRCITLREAARLHSYPDWFQFDNTNWHGLRQIGNSVPPLLAKAVAASVLESLHETKADPHA